MLGQIFLQAGVLFVVYILYRIVSSRIQERRFQAFANEHGCEPAYNHNRSWFQIYQRMQKAKRKPDFDFIEDWVGDDFAPAATIEGKTIGGGKIISTIEPANIQAMLATQFDDFQTGMHRYRVFGPLLGKSIFTSDGPFWAHSRALFRPQFTRDNINDLEATEQASRALIDAVGPVNAQGWSGEVHLGELCFNFTLDTASAFLFGESIESQRAQMLDRMAGGSGQAVKTAAGSKQFRKDFEMAGGKLMNRMRLFALYWMADSFEFRRAVKRIKQFTEQYAQAAIQTARSGKISEKSNLLARLATETQDITELRDQTLSILVAGRDTTASLLGFAFAELSLHPDIFNKLRSVILRDFEPGREISFAGLKGCRYLQHFLNEVLRLHPTVPMNGREAVRDTTLPTGGGPDGRSPIAIRKDQQLGYSVFFMHRRKDLWGPDVLEFKPERWEQKIPAWQFLPFNGGPRICLGQQFALVEASYLIVRLLQQYDRIEPVDRQQMAKLKKGIGLTMWPADGVPVRLHEATAATT